MIVAFSIFIAVVFETLLLAQLPVLLVAPSISLATLILFSRQMSYSQTIISYMATGLFYDILRENNFELSYFVAFAVIGIAIATARSSLTGESPRQRRLFYASVAAFSSLVISVLPALGVVEQVGVQFLMYSIIVQFVFISGSLLIMRLAAGNG